MFRRLLPREISFFNYFEQSSKLSIEVCRELNAIALNPAELVSHVDRIKEIELQADKITHECIEALHRTFITPIDRADIHQLIRRQDDIIDSVNSVASRLKLYEITDIWPELKQFAEVLVRATTAIDRAVGQLHNRNKGKLIIEDCCQSIHEAENEADRILRSSLARLFQEEKEPLLVIKWKEIIERLEKASDRCEDVANIIEGIVIEAS